MGKQHDPMESRFENIERMLGEIQDHLQRIEEDHLPLLHDRVERVEKKQRVRVQRKLKQTDRTEPRKEREEKEREEYVVTEEALVSGDPAAYELPPYPDGSYQRPYYFPLPGQPFPRRGRSVPPRGRHYAGQERHSPDPRYPSGQIDAHERPGVAPASYLMPTKREVREYTNRARRQGSSPRASEQGPSTGTFSDDVERQIGETWSMRLGIAFVVLGYVVLMFLLKDSEAIRMALTFLTGGLFIVAGMAIQSQRMHGEHRHLSNFGQWLVMLGTEILYVGAWRTHIPHDLITFEEFMVLILGIVSLNIWFSLKMHHPVMNLQYLTTFYLVCIAVFNQYGGSEPQFAVLFLAGTALFLAVDQLMRKPDNTVLTLTYSSVVLFIFMGYTGGMMPWLLGGYLVILLAVSLLRRDVDTFLGFGRVPDLYWGSMLTLSYLHSLDYLIRDGDRAVFPVLFGLISFGMLATYYLPGRIGIAQRREEYRFATDLEFFFITGLFFLLFFTITPDPLLLPGLAVTALFAILFNLGEQEEDAPHMLTRDDFLARNSRKELFYILNNRVRFHLFLTTVTAVIIAGSLLNESTLFEDAVYFTGFFSIAAVMGFIEYRRSREDALQTMRVPEYDETGELKELIVPPDPNRLDRNLQLPLKGVLPLFGLLLLTLSSNGSLLPLAPFVVYTVLVFFLNLHYSMSIREQIRELVLRTSAESPDHESPLTLERYGNFLKANWRYGLNHDFRFIFLGACAVFTLLAGLVPYAVDGLPDGVSHRMPALSLFLFLGMVAIHQVDVRFTGRNALFPGKRPIFPQIGSMNRIGKASTSTTSPARTTDPPEAFPGLLRDTEGYLLYIPFIPLILAGALDYDLAARYDPYLFLIPVALAEHFLFPRSRIRMPLQVATVIIIGLMTSNAPFAGFMFLGVAIAVLYQGRERVRKDRNLLLTLPLVLLYTARVIHLLSGDGPFEDSGQPGALPLTLEFLSLCAFCGYAYDLYRSHPSLNATLRSGGNGSDDSRRADSTHGGEYSLHLLVMLLLLPVSIPNYHSAILIIPAGVLYLSLRLNAPMENIIAFSVFLWSYGYLVSEFTDGKPLIYALLLFVSVFIGLMLMIERKGHGNLASIGTLQASILCFLVASAAAFDGGVTVTAIWALLGAGLVGTGFALHRSTLRWTGLGVITATALKILVYDLSEIPTWARVISLVVTGVVLLGISYLYRSFRDQYGIEDENDDAGRPGWLPDFLR